MRLARIRSFFAALTTTLTECIRYHVRYHSRDENGETRAERNERFGMGHKTPEAPEVPDAARHVWEWFWTLSSQRRSGMGGPEAIGWDEISAWACLTGTLTRPEEVAMLVAMDGAYRAAYGEEQASRRSRKGAS